MLTVIYSGLGQADFQENVDFRCAFDECNGTLTEVQNTFGRLQAALNGFARAVGSTVEIAEDKLIDRKTVEAVQTFWLTSTLRPPAALGSANRRSALASSDAIEACGR